MSAKAWTLALQSINVLILIWLLGRYFYRPMVKVVAARQDRVDRLLAEAGTAKEAAEAEAGALAEQRRQLTAEAEAIRSSAKAAARDESARVIAQAAAEAQAKARKQEADRQATLERLQADLEAKAALLARDMAERVLRSVPADQTTPLMAAGLVDRLRRLDDRERASLLAESGVTIATPMPLTAAEQAHWTKQIEAALPGLSGPAFDVDPTLIAGFELRGAHVIVRNSWGADLDRLAAALAQEPADGRPL